jgi:hypothetical protein
MRLKFFELPEKDRALYFSEAAGRRGLSPVIMEKDFWVCWMLGVLFGSRFSDVLVFKGGTSLSKVFGAINRFSEDIDLSVSPEFLNLPKAGNGRNQANKWMEKAEKACAAAVRDELRPELEGIVASAIGTHNNGWFEYLTDPASNSPVLLFRYPTSQPKGFEYLNRSVKLEFGSLTEQKPVGKHPIEPWIAQEFAAAFSDWDCKVIALELERSFWEKATILHSEYHRPFDKPQPDRFSRHYADTAALAQQSAGIAAVNQHELRDQVVRWKSRFFGSSWAHYETAKPGTFHLVPSPERISELKRDYRQMRDMYLSEPLTFDEIISILSGLEKRINQVS